MLLSNAILGNYGEIDHNNIISRFFNEKNKIYDNAGLSYVNIIFRVFPSADDNDINCSNKGLILKYFTSNNFSMNEKILSIKNHHLIPVFNEYNDICYWISNKCLKLRQDELHFSISSYVKEYWKHPVLCGEYYITNNNVIYSSDVNESYYIDYRRKIKIEREDKIQTLCIDLQFKNEKFIRIEYLNEDKRNNIDNISVIDLNNKREHDTISNDELTTRNDDNNVELLNNNINIFKEQDIESEFTDYNDINKLGDSFNYNVENEIEILIKSDDESEYVEYSKDKVEINSKDESSEVNVAENGYYNDANITNDDISEFDDSVVIHSNDLDNHTSSNVNYIENNGYKLTENECTKQNFDLNMFSVCNEININIRNEISNKNISLEKKVQDRIDKYPENSIKNNNSNKNSVTLEVIDDMITPIIRQIKNRSKCDRDYERQQNSETNNRSEFYRVESGLYYKNSNHTSFIPSNTRTDGNIVIARDNNINKELMILNRIETTRKNVNLNNKISVCKNNNQFFVCNNQSPHHSSNNYNNNIINHVNIDLLSDKFNRIIGKTDFLLEQLNSYDNNINNNNHYNNSYKDFNYRKPNGIRQNSEKNNIKLLISNQKKYLSYLANKSNSSSSKINKLESERMNELINEDSCTNINRMNKTRLELSKESCLSIISENNQDDNTDINSKTINTKVIDNQTNSHDDKSSNKIITVLNNNDNDIFSNNICNKNDNIDLNHIFIDVSSIKSDKNVDVNINNDNIVCNSDNVIVNSNNDNSNNNNNNNTQSVDSIKEKDFTIENKGFNSTLFDPELTEMDFYLNENRYINSFSIMNIILSKWSGIPTISRI
ncbi:hypothetical protein FG379_001733 [Cryptosporidium bovis]|uniref:uncharacterized protein n=1 Tax=Cryptosporidium bovis TaxID=310047 RepID=UPI00351A23D5|nr:hypothetical protein FG379_001733 [Cryptosporidium bovis]